MSAVEQSEPIERIGYSNDLFRSQNPSDMDDYTAKFKALADDCTDFERSTLAPARDIATKYYYGALPGLTNPTGDSGEVIQDPNATFDDILGVPEGDESSKSTYVSTDVKDVIKMILPALIRIYASSENVVTFDPRSPQEVDIAKQATDYINYVFWNDNPGFLILHGAFKDALMVKAGWVKWWTDDHDCYAVKTFKNVSQEQVQALMQPEKPGMQPPTLTDHGDVDPNTGLAESVTIKYQVSRPRQRVEGVPNEEMRVDRFARSRPRDARIIGHVRSVNSDVVREMGYDEELIENYLTSGDSNVYSDERFFRNAGLDANVRGLGDNVIYGEWYVRLDKDGDGYAELRHICTMGEDYDIVHDEPANRVKFALFQCDPVSHTLIGNSSADDTMDIQRIKTNMYRGVLDNLVDTLNPRSVVNELLVNMDDVQNDELGAIVRTRGDINASIGYTQIPFVGQQLLPFIQALDDARDRRTGVSDASKGLDPKALQSSTQIGVDAIINGAQERIELIARILAETGFRDLFEGLYNEVCENPNETRMLRINKQFAQFDTSLFDESMSVIVNPNMGKGTAMMRMMVLQGIKQDQQTIFTQFGPGNPVVGINEMLNTVEDLLELSNIQNMDRYFKRPDPQTLAAIEQAPKEPDAMTIAAKASMEKVKQVAASDIGKQQAQAEQFKESQDFKEKQLAITTAQTNRRLQIEEDRNQMTHEENLARNAAASKP